MLSAIEKTLHLRKVSVFKTLLGEGLYALSNISKEMHFKKGEIIFKEGAPGNGLYVVISGKAEGYKGEGDRKKTVNYFEDSDYFGEMALFDDVARSLTVRAEEDTSCLFIPKSAFFDLIDETPSIAINVIRVMSKRLREANLKL